VSGINLGKLPPVLLDYSNISPVIIDLVNGRQGKKSVNYVCYNSRSKEVNDLSELERQHSGKPIVIRKATRNGKSEDKMLPTSLFKDRLLQNEGIWVQIEGWPNGGKDMKHKEVHDQFSLPASDRIGVLNCVDLSIADREDLMEEITWRSQLEGCLLRSTIKRWITIYPILEKLRKRLYWALAGSLGATSNWHVDAFSTHVKVKGGLKLWGFMGQSIKNIRLRRKWLPKYGVWQFEGVFYIILKEGDELFMPIGTPHFVYSPEDTIAFGSYCILAPHLKKFVEVSTICRQIQDYTNEEMPEVLQVIFRLLIEVSSLLFKKA
jgi:hypothetical protein